MKSVARFLGKSSDHYYFSVSDEKLVDVINWLINETDDQWTSGEISRDMLPSLKKKIPLGISVTKISTVIRFEQKFQVSGLSIEKLVT